MSTATLSRARPAINPWLIAPVVALAAFMEVLDISIANVALPHIAGELSSSQDESTWVLTSYLVTNAIVMPISGWLSNRFGRKRFFLTCIAGFATSSLLCGMAPNLPALILLRAMQGAAGGGLQPSGQAILADSFPLEKRGMATAVYGVATVVAPIVGPTLGGWITDSYSWRWIFLINVPIGVILFVLIGMLIEEQAPSAATQGEKRSVDGWGLGFVALALGCLQVVLDRGQLDDWFASTFITVLALASAAGFVLLVWWELRHPRPMVNVRLLGNKEFGAAFGLMLMLGFTLLGSTYAIPALVQSLLGYPAVDAGLVITPGGFAVMLMLPIVGALVNKVDLRLLIAFGLVAGGASLWWMTNFYLGVSFKVIMLSRVAQSVAIAFLFIPINTLAFRSLRRDQTNDASALVNLARNFGGSIGIAFASTLVTRRSQFHQSRLVESLQSMNPAYPDYAHQVGQLTGQGADATSTLANIYQGVVQQAMLLSYLDAFKALAFVFFAFLPVLLLLKPGKGGTSAAMH